MALITFAQTLLDCAYVTLSEAGVPPCTHYLSPNPTPPLDSCCECKIGNGQLFVSLITSDAVDPFRGQPCGRSFRTLFRIGLTRCAFTITDAGTPPTPAQIQSDAEKIYRDQQLLLDAITCCWAEELDLDATQWAIIGTEVQPVQGGCLFQTVDVAVDGSLCSNC